MSHDFSERTLRDQEVIVRSYTDLFMHGVKSTCNGGCSAVDMVTWFNVRLPSKPRRADLNCFRFFTFDAMADLPFGELLRCFENSDYHPWVKVIFGSVEVGAYVRCSKHWQWLRIRPSYGQYLVLPEESKQRRVSSTKWQERK